MCAAPKKPDIERAELADGSIVCWPREYGHLEEPARPSPKATENRQRVVAALKDCQRTPASSEYAGGLPDFTGRYAGPESQCCINQAGLYLVVWWSYADVESTRTIERSWFYGAEFDEAAGRFVLHEPDDPTKQVADLMVVTFGSTLEITFDWYPDVGGPKDVLVRYSLRATLSERALDAIRQQLPAKPHPVVVGSIESEHAPLAPALVERYVRGLEGNAVEEGLQRLFREEVTHTAESWSEIELAIEPITATLYDIFIPAGPHGAKGKPIHDTARELKMKARVHYAIQDVLHGHSLALEVGKSAELQTATLYEWFQRALYYNEKGTGGFSNARFEHVARTWLGVSPLGNHTYELEIELEGLVAEAAIPVGKKIGQIVEKYGSKLPFDGGKRISKHIAKKVKANVGIRALTGPLTIRSRGLAENWEATYWVYFAVASGGSGGATLGTCHLRGTGTAETDLEWRPQHFPGGFTVLSGQAARDKQSVLRDHQLIWLAEGSHPSEPSIQLLLDDVETDLTSSTLGIGWGEIMDPSELEDAPPTPIEPKIFSYNAKYARAGHMHFMLGSATVLEDGRRLLRILAANELAALRDATTLVTFDGFADRLGSIGYNDALSEMRAENAKTAMLDCLGGAAAASMMVHGHGERVLALLDEVFHFPDGSPAPEWRRVFVIVHGEASVELVVRDLKDVK